MKKAICVLLLILSFFVFAASAANAQSQDVDKVNDAAGDSKKSSNGLENLNYKKLGIEILFKIDGKTGGSLPGLTEEIIRKKCESRLRQAGLEPVREKAGYLGVFVSVAPSYNRFTISLRFFRFVVFSANQKTHRRTPTWDYHSFGGYGKYAPEFIISNLDAHLDAFLSEYLKANSNHDE